MQRSRFVEILNVPHAENKLSWQLEVAGWEWYTSSFDSPVGLLDSLFEHPADHKRIDWGGALPTVAQVVRSVMAWAVDVWAVNKWRSIDPGTTQVKAEA